ncbi:helix-turn-helix domain-containing protein [Mucilaginibacter defluvii]|uniref:Helix-turn-helix domain-containing protein n=1 Tax=Mucilaginibacter defluvii TaxID=1196019 RepID=A0ABP9G0N8_9SPHI
MATEIITKEDLEAFEQRLFQKIEQVLGGNTPEPKKWLKSYQVKNMLRISPGTLQTLRVNGTLSYTKIGGILYYKQEDILKLLEGRQKGKQ